MSQSPLSSTPAISPANILVVDDNPMNLRALSKLLQQQGHQVRKARSGMMALKAVHAEAPDLILLDIRMPEMDGFSVCEQLKAAPETREIPVIFLSASDSTEDKVRSFQVGGNDFISKPFYLEEVIARVSSQLHLLRQRQHLSEQNAALLQEVRERAKAEAALREAELKYRSIFENANEGIFQSTLDGQYLSVNPAMARIYGYGSTQALQETVTDIGQLYVQPKRRQELRVYLQQYGEIAGVESEVYRKDGDRIWISESMRTVTDDAGNMLYFEGTVQDITEQHHLEAELRRQRQQSERLLFNVLPYQIAQRLRQGAHNIAESFDQVSVLFADLVSFTEVSTQMSPKALVESLSEIFLTFDHLVEQYKLEKIKTIGDEYMVAGGLPLSCEDHIEAIAQLALDMQASIGQFYRPNGQPFQLRIGINAGPVVAGVIGIKRFTYDLWGDTVNTASRMETTASAGRIQVPEALYQQLAAKFLLEPRGTIAVKGRGDMTTYWLLSQK
ncbi:MAG: adenylate/guanylate cyclase domain-containing protein [Cyanobacteria bacterium J06635_15]